jgi:hypothetical protein
LQVKLGEGMGGKVWQSEKPLLVDDYRSWEGRLSDKSLDDLHSVVGIPLRDRNGFHGVIGLASVGRGKKYMPTSVGNWPSANELKKPCVKARSAIDCF